MRNTCDARWIINPSSAETLCLEAGGLGGMREARLLGASTLASYVTLAESKHARLVLDLLHVRDVLDALAASCVRRDLVPRRKRFEPQTLENPIGQCS